jgi:hypothetical protein
MDDSIGAAQMVGTLVIPVPWIMDIRRSLLGLLMPRCLARLAKLMDMHNTGVKSDYTPGGVHVIVHHSQRNERYPLDSRDEIRDGNTIVFCP